MQMRYKIRFPTEDSFRIAQRSATHSCEGEQLVGPEGLKMGQSLVHVRNLRRNFISVEPSTQLSEGRREDQFHLQLRTLNEEFGAEIVEDYHYALESSIFEQISFGPDDPTSPSLDDVVAFIEADKAWAENQGENVVLAVVDTGIDGTRPEFPTSRRVGSRQTLNETPWTDWKAHGTMCACIAAATRDSGGIFNGIAPKAGLIACKTRFYDSELSTIYDYLSDRAQKENLTIIATN